MVSDVESINIKGTTAASFTLDPSQLKEGSVVMLNDRSNGPVVTTVDELKKAIPDRGSLLRPCGHCRKSPGNGKMFARCGKCKMTYYCSRDCQTANWPEHETICKQRQQTAAELEKKRAEALAEGKNLYDPIIIQTWYRENSDTIEHTAFHVLELWKGVELDETTPDNPKPVRYKDAGAVLYEKLEQLGVSSPSLLKKVIAEGHMTLLFVDVKHNIRLMEFHEPPPSEPYPLAFNGLSAGGLLSACT
uniref:MYND-type domain-containing protein n=1 Tax=Moniliophthora roreri TaxID=221103 RepID=A0A0W0FW00_MONRR